MGKETKSRTERDSNFGERLTGDSHRKTTIHDGKKKATGEAWTAEESQKIAKEKWDKGETSDIGCFLTTVCVKSMGLPDNCLELETLRNFRDRVLVSQPYGRRALKEYYRIAPEIVKAVEGQYDAQRVWQTLYRNIRQAVSLILSGDFEGAFRHYRQMTMELKGKYLD